MTMKKVLIVLLAMAMIFAFAACSDGDNGAASGDAVTVDNIKVGHIHINDEAEQGYSTAHINGINAMKEALGLADDQVIGKYNISEDASCADAIQELVEAGCNIIFADSFGFGSYMLEAAKEYPDVEFCHATGGDALNSGLDNFHNYFGNIYEARYLCGIVAGMVTEANQLGYVTAMENTECISGFTAFFLGARSVNPDVTMEVIYNNTWYDVTIESQSAQALIDRGADVLCQHADSPSTQTTAEAAGIYSIGYNTDMSSVAPNANLCSAVWNWGPVYQLAVESVLNGEQIPTDFSGDLADGMVDIVFNDALIDSLDNGQEIKDAVATAKAAIIAGELYPYVVGPYSGSYTSPYTGEEITIDLAEGEEYVEPQAAPQWGWILPGITVVR